MFLPVCHYNRGILLYFFFVIKSFEPKQNLLRLMSLFPKILEAHSTDINSLLLVVGEEFSSNIKWSSRIIPLSEHNESMQLYPFYFISDKFARNISLHGTNTAISFPWKCRVHHLLPLAGCKHDQQHNGCSFLVV